MTGALVLNGDKYLGAIEGDYVVCCDGGYDKSNRCDCFVGDMDSVNAIVNCPIVQLDVMKNYTDGEVGIDVLIAKGCDEIVIYGLDGGRFDHQLMNINLMARAVMRGVACSAKCNSFVAVMTDKNIKLVVELNTIVSLVPFCDNVHISYTKGLQYPLKDFEVDKFSSRTISNVATDTNIEIGLCGLTLIIMNK